MGPIAVPKDFTIKKKSMHKNESQFTNSLLAGDAKGYAHMPGAGSAGRNTSIANYKTTGAPLQTAI